MGLFSSNTKLLPADHLKVKALKAQVHDISCHLTQEDYAMFNRLKQVQNVADKLQQLQDCTGQDLCRIQAFGIDTQHTLNSDGTIRFIDHNEI